MYSGGIAYDTKILAGGTEFVTEGGSAIPYWMEDPYIRQEYLKTLEKEGVESRMDPAWYDIPKAAE